MATYYVKNGGSDSLDGLSDATAFDTVTYAHSVAVAGDEIWLKRGAIFYENFIPQTQATVSNPIILRSYGDENLPLPEICGGKILTGWTSIGDGLYKITDTGFPSRVNVMVFDNATRGLGTFPKQKGGYQMTGGMGSDSGTVSDTVNLSGKNFTGGEVVVRKWQWVLDRGIITNHVGSTLSFTGMSTDTIKIGWGYFVQNHRDCCIELGDWCQEGDDIIMYFGANDPNDYNIKCSYHEQILFNNKDFNHFYGIRFTLFNSTNTHTNNVPGIATISSQGIKFFDCEFQYFYVLFYPDATNNAGFELNNCKILDTLNIVYFNRFQTQNSNYTITNCLIDRTGLIPGAGGNSSASYSALVIPNGGGVDGNILGNRILNTGYNAININGQKFTVDKNYISHACLTKDDGGGIYSFGMGQENETTFPFNKTDRRITNNIITNVFGAPEGRPSWFSGNPSFSGEALYLDDNSRQFTISGNICFDNRSGLKLHNTKDIDVLFNLFYNNENYQVIMPDDTNAGSFDIRNINFNGNVLYASTGQGLIHLSDEDGEIDLFGLFDFNYYMRPSDEAGIIVVEKTGTGANTSLQSLAQWKSNGFGYDANSLGTPTTSTISELALNDSLENIIYHLDRIRLDIDGIQVNEPFGLDAFSAELLLDDLGPTVNDPIKEVYKDGFTYNPTQDVNPIVPGIVDVTQGESQMNNPATDVIWDAPTGSAKFLMELDRPTGTSSSLTGRTEHTSRYPPILTQEDVWFSVSYLFPLGQGVDPEYEIIYQWHVGSGSPNFSFRKLNGRFVAYFYFASGFTNQMAFDLGPTTLNVKHDFIFRLKFHPTDGQFTAWKDGVLARCHNPVTGVPWTIPTSNTGGITNDYIAYPSLGSIHQKEGEVDLMVWNGKTSYGTYPNPSKYPKWGFYKAIWSSRYNTDGTVKPEAYIEGNAIYVAPDLREKIAYIDNVKFETRLEDFTNLEIYTSLDKDGDAPLETPIWWVYVYEITVTQTSGGVVTGEGSYNSGDQVQLVAIPDDNMVFVKWSDDTSINPYIFNASENIEISAVFAPDDPIPPEPDVITVKGKFRIV